jgi:plasmid stabilization system protein ParE
MPQVKLSNNAVLDLQRCFEFILPSSFEYAKKSINIIMNSYKKLEKLPNIGRISLEYPNFRELITANGYVSLYEILDDEIIILAVRHEKESVFKNLR